MSKEKQPKVNDKSNWNTKYTIKEEVKINSGFFKGTQGIIIDVEKKDNKFIYEIETFEKQNGVKVKGKTIYVYEERLSKNKLFGLF